MRPFFFSVSFAANYWIISIDISLLILKTRSIVVFWMSSKIKCHFGSRRWESEYIFTCTVSTVSASKREGTPQLGFYGCSSEKFPCGVSWRWTMGQRKVAWCCHSWDSIIVSSPSSWVTLYLITEKNYIFYSHRFRFSRTIFWSVSEFPNKFLTLQIQWDFTADQSFTLFSCRNNMVINQTNSSRLLFHIFICLSSIKTSWCRLGKKKINYQDFSY